MKEITVGDKKVIQDIKEIGWHVVKILEDETGPSFCFTIGLYKTFKHPEVVIIGLDMDLAHAILNNIGKSIKEGKRYETGEKHNDILDGYDCIMINIEKKFYEEYLGYAMWYYNSHFPAIQCIYPTVKGYFPWQNEWPKEINHLQPLLGKIENLKIK